MLDNTKNVVAMQMFLSFQMLSKRTLKLRFTIKSDIAVKNQKENKKSVITKSNNIAKR